MKIPTIIVYSDYVSSGCSFYRSHGPFLELAKQGKINMIEGTYNDSWTVLRGCDIAFFQRPMSIDCVTQVLMVKDLGLKIWVDLDDHNFIPPYHPVYDVWCEKYDELSFQKIMVAADVVTTTTKSLQDYYLAYNNNVVIIPNAFNDYWIPFGKRKNNKTIILRGGSHHMADIWEYKKEIISVMKSHPDWTLNVLGAEVEFFANTLENYKFCGDYNIHQYFAFLLRTNPSVFIIPLMDNELNRGKSNIGWQEATISGAVALIPHWYNLNGSSLTYKDGKSFEKSFNRLLDEKETRDDLYAASMKKLKEHYLLSKVNNKRIQIIKNLMK